MSPPRGVTMQHAVNESKGESFWMQKNRVNKMNRNAASKGKPSQRSSFCFFSGARLPSSPFALDRCYRRCFLLSQSLKVFLINRDRPRPIKSEWELDRPRPLKGAAMGRRDQDSSPSLFPAQTSDRRGRSTGFLWHIPLSAPHAMTRSLANPVPLQSIERAPACNHSQKQQFVIITRENTWR